MVSDPASLGLLREIASLGCFPEREAGGEQGAHARNALSGTRSTVYSSHINTSCGQSVRAVLGMQASRIVFGDLHFPTSISVCLALSSARDQAPRLNCRATKPWPQLSGTLKAGDPSGWAVTSRDFLQLRIRFCRPSVAPEIEHGVDWGLGT